MMMSASEQIGNFIRTARKKRGWTQNELARKAGVAFRTINRWESGKSLPRLFELERTLDLFAVTRSERQRLLNTFHTPGSLARVQNLWKVSGDYGGLPHSGFLLRALRHRKGWTQEEVARKSDIQTRTLSRWERRESWPDSAQLHSLCYLLEATPEEIVALTCHDIETLPDLDDTLEQTLASSHRLAGINIYVDLPWDLMMLSLSARLLPRAEESGVAKEALGHLYSHYARRLQYTERRREAQDYADHCLALLPPYPKNTSVYSDAPSRELQNRHLWAVYVLAKTAPGGEETSKRQSVRLFQSWLPRLEPSHDDSHWFQECIAENLMALHETNHALEVARHALEAARVNHQNPLLRAKTYGELLIQAGKPDEAFAVLPEPDHAEYGQAYRSHLHILWAKGFLTVGNPSAAHDHLHSLYQLIEKFPDIDLDFYRQQANELVTQL